MRSADLSLIRLVALGLASSLAAAPARTADWSGELGVVSDYRFRGISLSGHYPAVQGGAGFETRSGWHGDLWGSTVKDGGTGHVELDATGGYAVTLTDTVSVDFSATYYLYPGASGANALEATAELEAERGPVTLTAGANFAPPQKGTRNEAGRKTRNVYLYAGASHALPTPSLPLSAHAQLGYERGAWDMCVAHGKWDWTVGLEAEVGPARLSLDHVGSNASGEALVGSLALTF